MIQQSPYYCTSITKAVDHALWTPQEQADLIQRHEASEHLLLVRRNPDAGKFLELSK